MNVHLIEPEETPESLAEADLHRAIMNLPDGIQPDAQEDAFIRGFRFGHRAARHQAAELVAAAIAKATT